MQPEGGRPLPEERALTRHNPAGGCPDLKLVFARAVRVKYLRLSRPICGVLLWQPALTVTKRIGCFQATDSTTLKGLCFIGCSREG